MDLSTQNQQLTALKARAAKVNSEINSSPTKEIKKARVAEYMHISAKIAELKEEIASFKALEKTNKDENRKPPVRVTTLYFPAEQRVQYFATTVGSVVELMILLQEVFEENVPLITSYYTVPADQVAITPDRWYELVAPDDIDSQ
jgi:hypothetical protein